ncbi:cyclophilin-like fold protein [uncultured Methanobrevibacter sp.]|uniref:cyclophilin-like fold protein n=1 Tax=uncultured Methanobrevibacter sp. TaxID=253161 RepID=UPI0025ECBCC7|nr:cyclophilin-like fold protein [uncultured Methanobrevibacter sp.]
MLDKKIVLVLIFIVAILSISAANASENRNNATGVVVNNESISDSMSIFNESAASNGSAQTELTKSNSAEPESISLSVSKLSTTYESGKYFKVKAIDSKTKKPVVNVKLILKVYSGKKYKKVTAATDSNGIAKYYASNLGIGTHKVTINVKDSKKFLSKIKYSSIKISRAKLKISAPKITGYYNESKRYKIAVKNRESKKPMKSIKVMIKVFTGKNYKKYSLKTDKKGIVSFNMKSLPKGKHNVVINIKSTSKVKSAVLKTYIKTIARSNVINLKVNNHVLKVKLEDNSAAKALMNKLKMGDVTIHAEDYGGFEKVGDLGFSLPRSDKYITTSAGDIVLYEGDEISLFYNSNSWSYTKLGKVQNIKDLKKILGTGDVKLVLSLK